MKNTLQPMSANDLPMEKTLCVFQFHKENLFLLGYVIFIDKKHVVKIYGDSGVFEIETFPFFQYVLNPGGGFLFIS